MSDVTPVPLSEEAEAAQAALCEIVRLMNYPAPVEVAAVETPDQVTLTLTSTEPLGMLIGKSGQTLNALELLVRTITQHKIQQMVKHIIVDAEGYRQRHEDRLRELAHETVRRVLETGEPISLEPMNPRDRRTVHMEVAEIEGVETFSVGDEPYRHLVICLPGQAEAEE